MNRAKDEPKTPEKRWKCKVFGRSGGVIQNGVLIGEIDESHRSPIIEEGVFVGARAIILGPVRIGKNAKIGAGSLVLQDVPDGCTAVGNPAHIICNQED